MADKVLIPGFDDDRDDSLTITLSESERVMNCVIASLSGYVDTYNSTFFQKQLMKILDGSFFKLILDCSELQYVSTTGVGVFADTAHAVQTSGGDFVLVNLKSQVYEVFQILGFSQYFIFKDTIKDAEFHFVPRASSAQNVFPLAIACPKCSTELSAPKAGRFRCPGCASILVVNKDGSVQVE